MPGSNGRPVSYEGSAMADLIVLTTSLIVVAGIWVWMLHSILKD